MFSLRDPKSQLPFRCWKGVTTNSRQLSIGQTHGGVRRFLVDQLLRQRRGEARGNFCLAEPRRQLPGFGLDRTHSIRTHVVEKAVRDLAVLATRPAPDDSAVPPHRWPRVPVAVEESRPMLSEVPLALLPA